MGDEFAETKAKLAANEKSAKDTQSTLEKSIDVRSSLSTTVSGVVDVNLTVLLQDLRARLSGNTRLLEDTTQVILC